MKRRALLEHLRKHGCGLFREDSSHSIFRNAATGKRMSLPRHGEIDNSTARKICKQLGIPPP